MKPITIRRTLFAVGLSAVAVLGVACSSTSEQVSDQIATQAKKQLQLTTEPTTTCPDDAKAEKGETFECTVELEKTDVPVTVTFKDDTNFTMKVQGAVYKKAKIESGLKEQLETNNEGLVVKSVTCPGKALVIISKDKTIDCTAVDDSDSKATLIVGLDKNGDAQIQDIKTD